MLPMIIFLSFFIQITLMSHGSEYVIDKVDNLTKITERECPDCPAFIGESFIVTPVTDDSGYKKEDLNVFGCHFTLIEKNKVLIASHCLRPWITLNWQELSNNQCRLVAGFYFPKTKEFPAEKARCLRISSSLYTQSGASQQEPDALIVELDRPLQRSVAPLSQDTPALQSPYFIWGFDYDHQRFEKRTCYALKKPSVLAPLHWANKGSYETISCDGKIEPGWSGAGLLDESNRVLGVVSSGIESFLFGASLFGDNEVVISYNNCINSYRPNESCFNSAESKQKYAAYLYLTATDFATQWQQQAILSLEKVFPGIKYEYTHFNDGLEAPLYLPAFKAICREKIMDTNKETALLAVAEMNSLKAKYVELAEDTTIRGVIESPSNGTGGSFTLSFQFIKGKVSQLPICSQ